MLRTISHFLATQGLIQAVSLVCGIVVLRLLSIHDFAIYVIFGALHNVGSFCADMGLSQAINTLGSKAQGDRNRVGTLLSGAVAIRRWLFAFSFLTTAVVAFVLLTNTVESAVVAVAGFLLVCCASWIHQALSMYTAVLNVHHDSGALFKSGITVGATRLLLITTLLPLFPSPIVAFAINLVGSAAGLTVARRLIVDRVNVALGASRAEIKLIVDFVYPLIPGSLYFLIQGQVATILLSIHGQVAYLAEVGALSRLAQILALLAMLNPFWVQPAFARISSQTEFSRKAGVLFLVVSAASVLVTATAFIWPEAWLLVLGLQYSGLAQELPVAVSFALISIIGGMLFTLVIAGGDTRRQYLQIPLGISAQCIVVFGWGVNSTLEALIVSGVPQVTYALLQGYLLARDLLRAAPPKR